MNQFKITLQDVKPAVWRRIQTPAGYSFWDLHVAIQDAMGWKDMHLHEFQILEPKNRRNWNPSAFPMTMTSAPRRLFPAGSVR